MSNSVEQANSLPDVDVREQQGISPIWLIPLATIVIGAWLLFHAWYQKGPTITVQFNNAEGIEAGKTEVRYKAVTIGKLRKLSLSDDLQNIEATLELNKEMGRHLGSDARFWVVSPRINRSGITGLSTFFSGTYIGMDPGTNTDDQSFYTGEDRPPVIAPTENGRRFFLELDSMASMDVGSPIFYKRLQVGEIIDYQLQPDGRQVRIEIFIRAPYDDFVHTDSRFWNASGAEFNMNAAGAEFRVESLVSLLVGSIAFENPTTPSNGTISPEGAVFPLYNKYADTKKKQFNLRMYYVMYFDGTVRGLSVGSPVEFQGIPIGQVENIDIRINKESLDVKIPVLVSIQPQYFDPTITLAEADNAVDKMVAKGLRAKLETGNLLTGRKLITMSMEKEVEPAKIVKTQFYSEFPTIGSAFEDLPLMATEVMASLQETLDGIKKLVNSGKLDKTVDNVNSVLAEAEQAVKAAKEAIQTVDKNTLPSVTKDVNQITVDLGKTLQKIQGSMAQVDRMTAENSPTQFQLKEMLEEVTAASRSVRSLTDTLQRKPSSLIRGK